MPQQPELQQFQWPNLMAIEGNALRIQQGRQELADYPEERNALRQERQIKLEEHEMKLQNFALETKLKMAELLRKGEDAPISLDYDFGTISGSPSSIFEVADAIAKYPDQVKHPNFMPWVASKSVTFKAKEKKEEKDPLAAGTIGQFEAVTFGKAVPELRGTPDYQAKFQAYMAQTRPYYPVIQTGEGFAQVNARQPGAPPIPVKGAGGEQLGARLSPNDVEELKMMKTTHTRLGDVGEKIKTKDISGPLEGRWQALKVQFVNDGPTQQVLNELNSMITLAYSLSGKQISYREMEILQAAILPNLKQPKMNLLATIEASKKWLAMTHDDRLSGYKDSGYSTKIAPIGGAKQPAAPAAEKPKSKFTILEVK